MQELSDAVGKGVSNTQDAKAVAVMEGKRRIALSQLTPKPPHAEVTSSLDHIVEENHTAAAHARQPILEVISHGGVGMQTIYVE